MAMLENYPDIRVTSIVSLFIGWTTFLMGRRTYWVLSEVPANNDRRAEAVRPSSYELRIIGRSRAIQSWQPAAPNWVSMARGGVDQQDSRDLQILFNLAGQTPTGWRRQRPDRKDAVTPRRQAILPAPAHDREVLRQRDANRADR
jgi:hypothetical protein